MTNREKMQSLDNEHFELVMHYLIFNPDLWVNGNYFQKHSTPSSEMIVNWLLSDVSDYPEFWEFILGD